MLDFAPVEEYIQHTFRERNHWDWNEPTECGALGGVNALFTSTMLRYYYRWRKLGVVTIDQADKLANALGKHPCEIWSEWFFLPQPAWNDLPEDINNGIV